MSIVLIVGHLFPNSLADTLYHSTVNLPGGEQRIDERTRIVNRDVVQNIDDSGFGIDLDVSHVNARW